MVLGIAPVAIIDRQLPFEYTVTSKSTDVVAERQMVQPVQNINYSAFKSMIKREKLSGNNFNHWFRQLKLVLRVEKKMYVIEQPLLAAPTADSETQFKNSSPYDMIKELKAMFEKQAEVERFDLIQTFHAYKQEEGKPVAAYIIRMKGYVDQLERLGYMLPQDLIVGLILNGITKDFVGFMRNYSMHNMGKTIGELYAMLIEYEKGLPKKAETSQVMIIKGGKIQKHPAKDDTCHHYKEVGYWKRNCPVYLAELLKKKKQVGSASSSDNVIDAPSITRGVVSVHHLVENGFVYNGIYEIDMHDLVPNVNSIYNVSTKRAKHNLDSTYLWRCRLAHISKKRIEKLQQEGLLKSTNDESFDQCVSCLSGKMIRKSFPHRPERATDLLGIIHTNVRYGYIYLLKHKHEVFETFKVFKNEVENQLGKTIKALRLDRGSEYIRQEFKDYLKACGIVQQLTPLYTPQHNGVSKRRNRTLLDMVRSMMNLTTLPLSFWDYALESATLILNMVPTKKVWECEALVKRDTPDKLQQRSVKCIFIGYPKEIMYYYFYFPPENKIVVARYAEFFEKNLITQEASGMAVDLEEIQNEDTSPSEITSEIPIEVEGFEPPQEEVILVRRSEKTHRAPDRLCLNVEAEEHSLGDLNEPTSYKAAMLDSESNKWIDAMSAEIQSMMDNMVWVLVNLPPSCKTVGSKWIFKKKTDMDGIVHTYKARLIAKGYTQLYEVDYEETFSPVADIRAIRILISIAAFYDYEIWQMDVKTSFLNGYLDEDIYMVQPECFVDPNHPRKVCKLQRSIYGLKQASRSWNKRFDEEIKRFCFDQNLNDPCVYQKASGSNVTFLILDRSKRLIGLGQNAYMDKILKRYKMDNSKRGHIPMQERLDLNKTQGASTPKEVKRMQNVPYTSVVGSIMYAVRCTRPDVAFAQNITSRFQQNPGESHWTAVKNILKYLRNTKDMFLVYGGNPEAELRVDCYCDAGFETDRDDTKSQTRYVFILNGGAVDWKSSKQSTTAMSATEAEYIAASEAAMEAVWIRKFISGLGIVPTINEPIRMFCDNSAALHFANEPGVQKGARHYHRRYHYVRESIALGEIRFLKVHTDDNLADPFTKALSKGKLTQHARSMGLRLASSFM
ncbi:retrotransposon protein, putative, ty1-copia subclass [Tanacetum coccineum]